VNRPPRRAPLKRRLPENSPPSPTPGERISPPCSERHWPAGFNPFGFGFDPCNCPARTTLQSPLILRSAARATHRQQAKFAGGARPNGETGRRTRPAPFAVQCGRVRTITHRHEMNFGINGSTATAFRTHPFYGGNFPRQRVRSLLSMAIETRRPFPHGTSLAEYRSFCYMAPVLRRGGQHLGFVWRGLAHV
jgi:hypothetical protein